MPYGSVAAAHKAAPGLFSVGGHKVNTLSAVNALARIYDAIKESGSARNAAAAAKATFRKAWRWDGSKWARRTTSKARDAMDELSKAAWDTKYINDLPDSAFAHVESGGKKDASGKTVPRGLRHYPIKDKSGKLDATHVRAARSYASREAKGSGKAATIAKAALPKINAAAKSLGIGKASKERKPVTTELDVPFAAEAVLVKAVVEDGKRFLVYACADDGPDLQKGRDRRTGRRTVADVIDKAFLEKMARESVEKSAPLVSTHEDPFEEDAPIAKAVDSWVAAPGEEVLGKKIAHHTLFTKFELADDPRADKLWERAEAGEEDARGVSVHGDLTKVSVEYHDQLHGWVRRLEDGSLDHHAVLKPGRAANPRMGLVGAMSKALDESGVEVDVPDGMEKAEVNIYGSPDVEGGRLTGYVRTEDDCYEWTGAYSFADAHAGAKLKAEMPRLNNLLKSTLENIMRADEDEVPDKRAAMKTSIDQYQDAVDALVADGSVTKERADELEAEALALVKSLEEGDATTDEPGAAVPETDGGEAADQEESTMGGETLEKALDPKAVAASLDALRKFTNTAIKVMGGGDEDAVPDAEGEDAEAVAKSLQDLVDGAERGELLYKGFANQPVLDGGTAGGLDAKMRERAQQVSPNPPPDQPTPGSKSNPGAMSKEQELEGQVAEVLKGLGVDVPDSKTSELEAQVFGVLKSLGVEVKDPQAQEDEELAKTIEGIVKKALGKVEDETVSKALREPKGLQEEPGGGEPLTPENTPAAVAARIAELNEAGGGEGNVGRIKVSQLVGE